MTWWRRLLDKKQLEKQTHAELEYHIDRQVTEHVRAGMSEAEARRKARLEFGGIGQITEDCRDARGTLWVETTVQDARYAVRTLRKSPVFTVAAVCTLALGIGANSAIFSVINGVILRPLPYREPDRLVAVQEQLLKSGQSFAFSYPDFQDCVSAVQSLEAIAAWRNVGVNVSSPGEPEYIRSREVSAGFVSVLGIEPILGRSFLPEEDRPGAAPVAMIGYSLWRQRFQGRPDAIGAALVINGKEHTVIGVLPANFRFLGERQVLTPIGQDDSVSMQRRDLYSGIEAVGRLRPGVTLHQANAELKLIGQRLAREYPATNRKMTFGAEQLKQQVIGDVGATLFLLAGAVGLVLMIACANVANLFLARSLSRTREFAIRAALGAGRLRMIRQLLTESIVLSLLGGGAGLAIAAFGTEWAVRMLPDWLPRVNEISLDGRVLLFTVLAAVSTGIIFGLTPAVRQRFDLETGVRQGVRGASPAIRRLQSIFVAAQFALALVLLTGAGLMVQTILRLWSVHPGFDPRNVLVTTVGLSPRVVNQPALTRNAWQQILERVQNTPGVEAAAIDTLVPLSGDNQSVTYWTSAGDSAPPNAPSAVAYTPTPGYLRTMRIPLLRGRFLTEQDRLGSAPVIVIDETLANNLFPGQDPVGKDVSIQLMGRVRIVGVVEAVKHMSLDEAAHGPRQPAVYIPFLQFPDQFMRLTANGTSLLVRTSANPMSLTQAIKQSVLGPGRDQPVRNVVTMEHMIGGSMARQRGMLLLLCIFAGVALVLASVGIYGVISYSISRRVQEIGVRMALGARPAQVLKLILRQGMRMVLAGALAGAAASFVLTRLLTKLLYDVRPNDPLTFAAVALTLCAVALGAIYVPARRAARIDPMSALRYE